MDHPVLQRAMRVIWPAFLMAGVLEMLVFAVVDPGSLRRVGGEPLGLSATAVYSLAFFCFWLVIGMAGAITLLLQASPADLNGPAAPARHGPGPTN